ncbi:MAG: tetratricopeptide repeat protein, partial [Magnetospirillum sp.]|nr:tetratricopeptide repeat protein [Magnetospirillum sp.]
MDVFQSAIRFHPGDATILTNLALAQSSHQPRQAMELFLQVLKSAPDKVEAWNGLGVAHMSCDDLPAAEQAFRHAIRLCPDHVDSLGNLGKVLALQGRGAEALETMRAAVAADPGNARINSNLLFLMRHRHEQTPEQIFAEHVLFGQRQEAVATVLPLPKPARSEAYRRLRIGYVSPDFCDHAAMLFFEPVLEHHHKDAVEVFCYHKRNRVDAVTRRLMARADHWRQIAHLPPDAAAEMIRADRIDILVDLAGHTSENGLPIFARKPAPIQATWLGYPGTSGLSRMDYRLTDAGADPIWGENKAFHTEELVHLKVSAAFRPPMDAPDITPAPILRRRHPRFGSFNKMAKVNAAVIATWSRILAQTPGADLVMVIPSGELAPVQQQLHSIFRQHGIDAERILVQGLQPLLDFLETVADVDIALDPFPYCGGTTSLLTLWMGVPLVSCMGTDSASATSPLLLRSLGLGELVAKDEDEYVRIACTLAADQTRLVELRSSLRDRLRNSAPFDEEALVRDLEHHYRDWWLRLIARETRNPDKPRHGTPALDRHPDPHWPQVVFSLCGEGEPDEVVFSDALGHQVNIKGAVAIAQTPPGGIQFGPRAYAVVPASTDWDFGAGDFTVECLCLVN